MELLAGRFGGLFGAGHNDVYKQLPMSGTLGNYPGSQRPGVYPVMAYSNQQLLLATNGRDAYVGAGTGDVSGEPPQTLVGRAFYEMINWIYDVRPKQAGRQGQAPSPAPVYHLI